MRDFDCEVCHEGMWRSQGRDFDIPTVGKFDMATIWFSAILENTQKAFGQASHVQAMAWKFKRMKKLEFKRTFWFQEDTSLT